MSEISFQDIKKAYVTKAAAKEITLCYSGKTVFVKPLRMRDKKEFLKCLEQENDNLLDNLIDTLIEKYVSDSEGTPIETKNLVDQERHQLLMMIRKISTQQEIVTIDHICPKCKVLNRDIQFPVENITVKNYVKPENDVIVTKNGDVKFIPSLLSSAENIEVENYFIEKKISTKIEKEFIRLASTVKQIYLVVDDIEKLYKPKLSERVEFVESLSFDDFEKLRLFLEGISPFGLSLKFKFKCTDCKYENEEEAKIVNFFIK